jgi:RimJ/RimL family protein N-acetyltransferase
MLGDINFFIYRDDDHEHEETAEQRRGTREIRCYGEVDIMVSARQDRGKGVGYGAVCGLLVYLHRNVRAILEEYRRGEKIEGEEVCLARLVAKIKVGNERSKVLFRRVGFEQRGEVNYFGEVEMGLPFGEVRRMAWFAGANEKYRELRYVKDGAGADLER